MLKDFLWVFNPTGGRKTTLVLWKKITAPKEVGGLGIRHIHLHSHALLGQWVIIAHNHPASKWSSPFFANLKVTRQNGPTHCKAKYTISNMILLGIVTTLNKLTYMVGIRKAWLSLQGTLALLVDFTLIPVQWIVVDLLPCLNPFSSCTDSHIDGLISALGRLNIITIEDIWSSRRKSWRNLDALFTRLRGLLPWHHQLTINLIDTIL